MVDISDRITVMRDGRVVTDRPVEQRLNAKQELARLTQEQAAVKLA